jgi:hypothetical protein
MRVISIVRQCAKLGGLCLGPDWHALDMTFEYIYDYDYISSHHKLTS